MTRDLTAEDDSWHHHKHAPDPLWNESAWFGFCVPEREINGFFYFWHRPNMNVSPAGVALWDASGSDRHDCLFYHWQPLNPMPADADMFSFALENGMSVEQLEPLQQHRLLFDDPGCRLDLLWTGAFPAIEMSFPAETGGGRAPGAEDFGSFHYEQLGHVTGTVELEGEELEVDCHHIRDRSWGVRRPFGRRLRGGLEMGWASENRAFCATMLTPEGSPDADADTVDRFAYGQIVIDGEASKAVAGERRVLERGPDTRPLRIAIELSDADGRELRAEGTSVNNLHYSDLWYVNWASVRWEIDGESGWGESQDLLHFDTVRRHCRAPLAARAGR